MKKTWTTRIYLLINGTVGLGALIQTLWGEHSLVRDLTTFTLPYRLTLLAAAVLLGALALGSLGMFTYSLVRKDPVQRTAHSVLQAFTRRKNFLVLILLLLAVSLIAGQWLLSIPEVENPNQRSLLLHLRPFFLWLILANFLTISVLVLTGNRHQSEFFSRFVRVLGAAALLTGVLLYLTQVAGVGFSEESEITGLFHPAGFPLLGYQVFFAWLGCSLVIGGITWVSRGWKDGEGLPPLLVDAALCLGLFLLAFALWNSVPLKPNWFVDIPRPPNFEPYPNSDAAYYDTNAQNLLAMGKFWEYREFESIGRRSPMLVFHAAAHAVGGLGYQAVTPLLAAGFAVIPLLLFLLGTLLHSRWAGLLAGVLFILRHYNGLLLGDLVTGANVKMLMSEIPTTFGVILSVLLGTAWLQHPRRRWPLAVLTGAVVGLTTLIRIENILLLPFFALPALWAYRGRLWDWVGHMLLPAAGLILMVSPWVVRNGIVTGELFLESPGNKVQLFLNTLRLDPEADPGGDANLPGSKTQGLLFPANESASIVQMADHTQSRKVHFQQEDSSTAEIIANHYANSLVQSVLYLPTTPLSVQPDYLSRLINQNLKPTYGGVFYTPEKYVRSLPYWFEWWDGRLKSRSILGFAGVVFVILWGLHSLLRKQRAAGLLPLAAMFSGITAYALIRYSGGRFLQKADWVASFYYAVGLVDLTRAGLRSWWEGKVGKFKLKQKPASGPLFKRIKGWQGVMVVLAVPLLLGSVLPGVELLLPDRYPDQALEERMSSLSEEDAAILSVPQKRTLRELLNNGAEAVYGRALYPRFFDAGETLIDAKHTSNYPRMKFFLTGTQAFHVSLPRSTTVESFPNGVNTLVLGCSQGTTLQAALVVLYTADGEIDQVWWREGDILEFNSCPLPDPAGN